MLDSVTIRDFGGGWDVSDSDKSLSSRYQTISDNTVRGTDGHFRVRHGYKLFSDLRKGAETSVAAAAFTVETTNGESFVKITKAAHGYASGDHVTISQFSATLNGIDADMMLATHGIVVIDADTFKIYVRGVATGTGSAARTLAWVHDTHKLAARDIFGRYYKDHMIVFSENGEIVAIDADGDATVIWSYKIADALTVEPWGQCKRVSAEIVRGRLIAVNGAENDKPLAIDGTTVNYLVDASSLSNNAIPRAEFVIAAGQYVILVNTEYGPTKLEIGAKNTVMTCSREVDPSDAVEFDVGMMTQTIDATILGASVIRSRVFLGFADRTMLGTLGIYTTVSSDQIHEPDFNDNIAEFGTFSHASIISLGNDLFCAGLNGINSLETSRASGEFVPQTISDLIHPVMLRHFSRLSEDDRRYRVFAVFDNSSRAYMLFAPKYSEGAETLPKDAITVTTTQQPYSLALIRVPRHKLDEGDYIDISGVANHDAMLLGSMINGRRLIRYVIDKDTLVVEVDAYPVNYNVSFGGSAISLEPVNDETVAYVYEYNPRLKIRRWTRFRGLDFDWGARSQLNSLFFGKNGRVYQFGDNNNPMSADMLGDYTHDSYATAHAYAIGDRVLDTTDGIVYECLIAHTSDATDTFAEAREALPDTWTEFLGFEIEFELETAWSDFEQRKYNKQIEDVSFDASGSASFDFAIFTNSIKRALDSYEISPVYETAFVGEDSPGFGGGDQPFGGGRNTKQEWLHSMPAFGKLFKLRWSGATKHPLQMNAVTLYYHKSKVLT